MIKKFKIALPLLGTIALGSLNLSFAQDDISKLAPEFTRLTKELINEDLWKRTDLTPRERSLITVTILATLNKTEQIDHYLNKALDNGLTQEEIVAAMTQTAFYAGWPSGYTGITHLKSVVDKRKSGKKSSSESSSMKVLTPSNMPNVDGPAEYFTGSVKVTALVAGESPSKIQSASVMFNAGARSAWHTHPRGQLLVVTDGEGLIQEAGKPVRKIKQGDVIWTPPGVKHWHGASTETSLTHIATHETLNGSPVNWMEKVKDE